MAAPLFSANALRRNPYRAFKFQVLIDGQPVAGFSKMSALKKTTEAIDFRSSGTPVLERRFPGGTKFEAVTLEQGETHDTMFMQWANFVNSFNGDAAMSSSNFRKDIAVNLMNLKGEAAVTYYLKQAWVSGYTALPDLDAGTNSMSIETIRLEHEGWERDAASTGPSET